jgi:general secretion pathway protein I
VRARHDERGFTLLEVMVALAVLALALTAVSDVVGGALRNHVRARQLDVATMLARGKLAEIEAGYEQEGFRDFDQKQEGTFEAEGHAEVKWLAEALKPQVELGPDAVLKALTGIDGGVAGLLGMQGGGADKSALSGLTAPQLAAGGAASGPALGMIQAQLTALGEQIKNGVRELRLTVSWADGKATESFTVVTYLVVLTPGSEKAAQSPVVLPTPGTGPGPGVFPGPPPRRGRPGQREGE